MTVKQHFVRNLKGRDLLEGPSIDERIGYESVNWSHLPQNRPPVVTVVMSVCVL
jgi:hypothetical protein